MYTKPFRIGKLSHNVIHADYRINSGDKIGILLTADHHFDNPYSVHKLLKRDHEEAVENDAMIVAFGDIFCAMQGKFDRRHSKGSIRDENMVDNYLGSLIKSGSKFYRKYAENYIMMSPGNHETAVLKRSEYDLIEGLVTDINLRKGTNIQTGPYKGWLLLRFYRAESNKKKSPETVIKVAYHHGHGGGGPVTKGVIQTNRRAIYMPDADVVVTGHIHEKWILSLPRERIDTGYNTYYDEQYHVQVPTYKEEYGKSQGWHVERGAPPKPLGGIMMEITKKYRSEKLFYHTNFLPTFDMKEFQFMTR